MLKIEESLVSVDWLHKNMKAPNLIVLDASIKKVTDMDSDITREQIPSSRYLDLKNKFSDASGELPNTFPSEEQFTREAQNLGINSYNAIVIYDDKGIYSSPRAWWLFKAFGHDNVAVLDGGLPEWKRKEFKVGDKQDSSFTKGNFKGAYNKGVVCFFEDIVGISIHGNKQILDARSDGRFNCTVPEPRKGLRSGTISNSRNLPFNMLLKDGKMKPKKELKAIFTKFGNKDSSLVFSCGSGITACLLALGATLSGFTDLTVYDGSWTEYGSLT